MSTLEFDATNIEPQSFEPLPAGWYNVIITESEVKSTKAGNGQYLKVKFLVIDGTCKGRSVFDNINIKNPSQQAQEIGRQRLSGICHAVGILKINESCQLHNLPLSIRLELVKRDDGKFENRVKEYAKKGSEQNASVTPSSDSGSPWERKA